MAFECNIDAKGKAIRLFGGIFSLILGLIISSIAYFDVVEVAYLWVAADFLLVAPSGSLKDGRGGVLPEQWGFGPPSDITFDPISIIKDII